MGNMGCLGHACIFFESAKMFETERSSYSRIWKKRPEHSVARIEDKTANTTRRTTKAQYCVTVVTGGAVEQNDMDSG